LLRGGADGIRALSANQEAWSRLHRGGPLTHPEETRRSGKDEPARCGRLGQVIARRGTLEDFQWSWPRKINRPQIQNLFRLAFIAAHANIVLIGNVGLGKTHLSIALGHAACLNGHTVLFTTAIDIVNTLAAAQAAGRLKRELTRYLKPALLIVDELGYLPIDKHGADLLFQIISQRYERAPMVITTNRAYKHWSRIFNNDSTLTSAILDRVLHHAETVIIEGKSFRMKDEIEE
jgi:DNA replication protein DnaC